MIGNPAAMAQSLQQKQQQANAPGLGLNLSAVNAIGQANRDFQDDFLAKYDEFSESWRQACD